MKVLLVEDSRRLQSYIAKGLRNSGYSIDVCDRGDEALTTAIANDYDVIVLDLLLPGLDGLSVLQRLRAAGNQAHVLILSAKDQVDDRVRGLRAGADDYLVKPFSFDELVARIDALVRRGHASKNPTIEVGPLVIDTTKKLVTSAGVPIVLTLREYRLLEYLAFHLGTPVSREKIEEHIYGSGEPLQSNAVDSAICLLRSKIDRAGAPSLIRTRRGLGYSLQAPAGDADRIA